MTLPRRDAIEILAQLSVPVDDDRVAPARDLSIRSEQDAPSDVENDLHENGKIIVTGILQVREGDKFEDDFRPPARFSAT